MGEADEIQTGVEQDSDVTNADADIFAYADDGEHATVWEIDRLSSTIVRVNVYRCEAGLSERESEETFEINPDKTTKEWARECANADPEEAVNLARDYWN